jgi:taurine dioxygenase
MPIQVRNLGDEFGFGSVITGVDQASLNDEGARRQINEVFEQRGLIVFDGVEASIDMHLAVSNVFGPLKDHPVPVVARVDQKKAPGVIDMKYNPADGGVVEIDGKPLAQWLPWHFDHCYNNELNRAGVLRAVTIPPEGGRTGFADGIELYNALTAETISKIEGQDIVYTLDLLYAHMRFGVPKGFRELRVNESAYTSSAYAKNLPRAIHPAVWKRKSGEKVLHVSPWMAVGIRNQENPQGDALLEQLCQEMIAKIHPYYHSWKPDQMVIWDNWRMLHSVSGMDPKYERRMQRTTIVGDYGLGSFEGSAKGDKILEMTV